MFLSIATTHRPATDLGFLLMKHPDRRHEVELAFGKGHIVFPEASEAFCEAALVLDIDPIELVRGRGKSDGLLDQYVNDRPYAASSFLAVALNRAFRTAMSGVSRERPELAASPIPLKIHVEPLPVRGSADQVEDLFGPLGWTVEAERLPGIDRPSRYIRLKLTGTLRLADALSHLYVLIPALDEEKHYWVGEDEVDKLLDKGADWLRTHPARDLIARRYLKHRSSLARLALQRLNPEGELEGPDDPDTVERPEIEADDTIRLHDLRLDTVARILKESGARSVADLGCGEGKLLRRLLADRQFERIIGLDTSSLTLERAADRLKFNRAGGPPKGRLTLLHGALTYCDTRWHDVDAAGLVEVIEHLDQDRLPALTEAVFGAGKPRLVIVTTPNREHNALFPTLGASKLRHPDHRFEWTRAECRAWAAEIESKHGYAASFGEIGESDPTFGAPTQMVVFTR